MGSGRLEVVCGPMFSGKTEALIKRATEMRGLNREVAVFKPVTDTRHMVPEVVSHNGTRIEAQWLQRDAPGLPRTHGLIAIDEVQFCSLDAVPNILAAVRAGAHVLVAGLDLTYRAEPFGPVPALMAYADVVTKLTSRCAKCHESASRTQRHKVSYDTVLVGGAEFYEPRCLVCFDPHGGT